MRAKDIREIVLEQSKRAHVGPIDAALSMADLIATLYSDILQISNPHDPDRDRFVLSKGHAALALYAALFLKGWISQQALNAYCADASLLDVHREHSLDGVDFSTGALDRGLPFGVGAALAARLQGSARRIYVLVSDLANLTVIVDRNNQHVLGDTGSVIDLSPLRERWRAFGWDVYEVNGQDTTQIAETIASFTTNAAMIAPHVLIARTTFRADV
ncbi:MAG: transketolase [Thermomicrobiales bacterium]